MNRTKFDVIKSILVNYKVEVNGVGKNYINQLKRYRDAYNEEFFQEKKQELNASEKSKIDSLRNTAKSKLEIAFNEIRDELHIWSSDTSKLELIQSLSAVKTAGVHLSRPEIQSFLNKSEGNYLTNKLLSQISKENGYFLDCHDLEDYENTLKQVESAADTMLRCYCGSELEVKSLISENIRYGVSYGEYPSYILATADSVLKQDGAIDKAIQTWEQNTQLCIKEKTELSQDEKTYIDNLYEGYNGKIADRTTELLRINPKLKESLVLHENYEQFVPREEA